MFTQLVLVPNHENCNFLETNLFNNMLSLILCKLMYREEVPQSFNRDTLSHQGEPLSTILLFL